MHSAQRTAQALNARSLIREQVHAGNIITDFDNIAWDGMDAKKFENIIPVALITDIPKESSKQVAETLSEIVQSSKMVMQKYTVNIFTLTDAFVYIKLRKDEQDARITNPATPFTDVKLAQVAEVLLTCGLLDEDLFKQLANSAYSYGHGGLLEYTQRETGMRFLLNLDHTGTVHRVQAVVHHAYGLYPQEHVDRVNARLATILAG